MNRYKNILHRNLKNISFDHFSPDYEYNTDGNEFGYEYDPATGACTCKSGCIGENCKSKL